MRKAAKKRLIEITALLNIQNSGPLQRNIHMSRLRACGPVIPRIPQLAGVDPARYALGHYGDQDRYSDGILFLFVGGLTH